MSARATRQLPAQSDRAHISPYRVWPYTLTRLPAPRVPGLRPVFPARSACPDRPIHYCCSVRCPDCPVRASLLSPPARTAQCHPLSISCPYSKLHRPWCPQDPVALECDLGPSCHSPRFAPLPAPHKPGRRTRGPRSPRSASSRSWSPMARYGASSCWPALQASGPHTAHEWDYVAVGQVGSVHTAAYYAPT